MKKAYLVTVSVTTRVVVDAEDEDDDIILEHARPRLRDAIAEDGVAPFLDEVCEDTECPYDPETDD